MSGGSDQADHGWSEQARVAPMCMVNEREGT